MSSKADSKAKENYFEIIRDKGGGGSENDKEVNNTKQIYQL